MCQKRNDVSVIEVTGEKTQLYRCANMKCPLFTQQVTQSDCDKCEHHVGPRVPLIKDAPTKNAAVKAAPNRRGAGDWAEAMLTRVGVTEERYIAAKAFILRKQRKEVRCGCKRRKSWLNKIERDLRSFLSK